MDDAPKVRTGAASPILVVDLDGTLIRSDMLHENFWSAFSEAWSTPFVALRALGRGRAALKRRLAGLARTDPALLPYNPEVIAYIEAWRRRGGRVALVTASDQTVAEAIALHLGLFDDVHGSDGRNNLKGAGKAAFLDSQFGRDSYAYMGDHAADLAVWRGASRAITVDAGAGTRRAVEALGIPAEHLSAAGPDLRAYVRAVRPHQWLKNALVFLPMMVAHQLNLSTFVQSLAAFIAFSLVASSVYLLNDLLDLSADRAHPRKRFRPLASGAMPIAHGSLLATALLLAGLLLSVLLGPPFLLVMAGYYAVTLAYSLYLKRRVVIDICALAGLYTIRIVAGGAATGIPLSVWLLAFSIFFFFSLATVKRQAELIDSAERGVLKASGRGYHVEDLAIIAQMATASGYVSVLVMALYVNSPAVTELYHRPEALWGICLVLLYWISRIVMETHRGRMHDDPVVFAVKDRVSQACVIVVALLAIVGAGG